MFGGADPAVTNLVPSDIVLRRNHLFKPLAWRNPILAAPGGARLGGHRRIARLRHPLLPGRGGDGIGTRSAVSAPSSEVVGHRRLRRSRTVTWSAVPGADKYRVYRGTTRWAIEVLETTATSLAYPGSGENRGNPATSGTKWVVKNTSSSRTHNASPSTAT